jgi:VanZ family protein
MNAASRRGTVRLTRRMRSRSLLRWGAAIGWMVFIYYLSAQPSLPRLTDRLGSLQSVMGHLIAYAVLAFLLQWSLAGTPSGGSGAEARRVACWALFLAVAFGITDEFHQHFVPGRHMDPLDLLTDAIGAAATLWVARVVRGRGSAAPVADERDHVGL